MINLNDEQFKDKEVKIFNGGDAGIVKNCGVRIERKKADDAENAPDYKLYVIDETGAEINKGYFKNFENWSDNRTNFFVKEMKHLGKVFNVRDKMPEKVNSLEELLDTTMKLCAKNQNNVTVNVAVCYGNTDYPRRFLEIDGFWGIQNVNDGAPRLSKKALLERPALDEDKDDSSPFGDENNDDLPWSE